MATTTITADLRLSARPHPYDPLVAVVEIPDGLLLDEGSRITDAEGHRYSYAREEDFERLVSTAPFSQFRFFPLGQQLHVLPPDTTLLFVTL